MVDRILLEAFLAVVDTRHFGRAAFRLGVAQSVVSKRIRRLEDVLGARLMHRGARARVELTRTGALFEAESRRALGALATAERIGRNLARGTEGPLRVGFVFSAAMTGLLPRLLERLLHDLPQMEVMPRLIDTPRQLAMIDSGELDVALTRPRPSYPAFTSSELAWREELIVAMSTDSPLASMSEISVSDVAGETFIVPQFHERVGLLEAIETMAGEHEIAMPDVRMTDDFISAAALSAAGAGIVLAPRSLRNLSMRNLRFAELKDYRCEIDLIAICRDDAPEAAVKALRSELSLIRSEEKLTP